jgi:hypothetical protein
MSLEDRQKMLKALRDEFLLKRKSEGTGKTS